jgi:Zn-dependent protease with chaperone function
MRRTVLLGAATLTAIAVCMLAPASAMRGTGHVLLFVGGLLAVAFLVAVGREARRHQRLAETIARRARPASVDGHSVGLVPGLGAAFVAGLRWPRIFCADDLPARLDAEELRAVILHEHHHQLDWAPAKLVLLGALAPVLDHLETGRAWLEHERARIEIAADAYALASGASRPALASALLKLSSSARVSELPAFASAADLRVRALLGEATEIESDGSPGRVVGALVIVMSCPVGYLL